MGGKVIVSDGVNPGANDIIFVGDPTPNMLPLDDHAREVSASFADRWKAPNENSNRTHSQSLLDDLERQMQLIERKQQQAQQAPMAGMDQLLTAITQMMQQNQQIMLQLAGASPTMVNPTGAYEPPLDGTGAAPELAAQPRTGDAPARRV